MYFSHNLKRLRKQRSLTQEQLSQELNVSSKVISSWENNRTEPDFLSLQKISTFFDTTIDELIHHKGKIENQSTNSRTNRSRLFSKFFIITQLILVLLMYGDGFGIMNFIGAFVLGIVNILAYSIFYRKTKMQTKGFLLISCLPFSLILINLIILFQPLITGHITGIMILNIPIMLNIRIYYVLAALLISMSEFSIIVAFLHRKS
ncbi:helix-turn-helix transcriptional regulator [Holzapfeliella sp. He02]|uniref:Helix-turn-helix transcriptional regulator n=1 Tax=Holzapfeliella saturejae TaxID=3082953 RepID=A0ABU8SG34_9LACO